MRVFPEQTQIGEIALPAGPLKNRIEIADRLVIMHSEGEIDLIHG
jgi:hypothetical protein